MFSFVDIASESDFWSFLVIFVVCSVVELYRLIFIYNVMMNGTGISSV